MFFTHDENLNPRVAYAQQAMRIPLAFTLISEVLIAMYVVSDFEDMPDWVRGPLNALAVTSAIYLSGITYSMVNHIPACYNNIKYFTEKHEGEEKGLVKTQDVLANAVIWGMFKASGVSSRAAFLFGFSALVSFAAVAPLAPFLIAAFPLVCMLNSIGVAIASNRYQNKLLRNGEDPNDATIQGNQYRNKLGNILFGLTAFIGLIVITTLNSLIGTEIISVPDELMSNELQAAAYGLPAGAAAVALLYFFSKCAYLALFPHRQSEQFTIDYPADIRARAQERQALIGNSTYSPRFPFAAINDANPQNHLEGEVRVDARPVTPV